MRAEIPSGRDPSPKDLEDLADALGVLRADQRAEALAAAREAVAAGLDADRRAKAMGALVALAGALAEFDKGLERREVTAVRMARSEAKVALAALADSAEVLEALAGRVQALWNAWGEEGHGEPARQTPRTTTACYTDGCGSGWHRRKSERALSAQLGWRSGRQFQGRGYPTPAFARAVSVAGPPILPTPTDRPFLLPVSETAIVFTLVASRHLVQILIVA